MLDFIKAKILNQTTLLPTLARWQLHDQKIVFTNGCFDILHYGHLHYLAAAKALGDKLIIGVNSANSVKRLKGEHRPINDDLTRYHLLAALSFVDGVIEPEQIVGADVVLANGGEVKSLPFVAGYSTTNIETKIQERYKGIKVQKGNSSY